ncbi:MAG: alpha/beta fold hydrolase [Saprospiraceae bacterium]|nr:alpha/beta fold hydrolase [Saprospiraceae bacterium]
MPVIEKSTYPGAPFWQFNGHLQTLAAGLFRKLPETPYRRERIDTQDGDFLDLDWLESGRRRLAIISHGLEGNSTRPYVRGMAALYFQEGWDVLAWNCRSCSGEMNRTFRLYHHGDVEDIGAVVRHALQAGQYDRIALVGFSMGANITMKYLGVHGAQAPVEIRSAVAFSAPVQLEEGAEVIDRWDNFLYRQRFKKRLGVKLKIKAQQYPGLLDIEKLEQIKRWRDFDEWFSAPICGYRSADEFYQKASAANFLDGIRVPTLLVNALNDPILTPGCMPETIAREHEFFHLEMPEEGGHCGFQLPKKDTFAWSEYRALEFSENA